MSTHLPPGPLAAYERIVPVQNAGLYAREIGQGQPILLLHGGPDFDHSYFLPDMDRLAGSFRLIYYDQRGRGKSAGDVHLEDVSLESEIADLESLRDFYQLEPAALLGHSWGALLALEYALRYPDRVSHLILINTAPVSHHDYMLLRQARRKNSPADIEELKTRSAEPGYQAGDPEAVAGYYRIHFRAALRQSQHLDSVIERLRASFTKEGILKARAIEKRLMDETWLSDDYDLLSRLKDLRIPALVIHGAHDFVPIECAAHIAQAIPGARFVLLPETGHFSFLESPNEFRKEIIAFINSP